MSLNTSLDNPRLFFACSALTQCFLNKALFGKVINHHRPARILTSFISFQTFKGVDRLPIVFLPCDIDIAPAKQGSPSKTLRPPVHVGLHPHLASRGHLVLQPSHVWPHCNWLQCHSTSWPHFVSRSPSSQRSAEDSLRPSPTPG